MRSGYGVREQIEARIRRAWSGPPGGALQLASAAYGAVTGARNLLYDCGFFTCRRAPVPVVSVGGLTVGGSGKTPITADLAARLGEAGVRTAILTHGFDDEMDVHRKLAPAARVYGDRDRGSLSRRAAAEGAQIALLDSGFQHRRLHRDLDIVALDEASAGGSLAPLPAGPFREGLEALTRADLVVVVRRAPVGEEAFTRRCRDLAERGRSRLRELEEAPGAPPFVTARILPGPLLPANEPARAFDQPRPTVAVAGIMWPEVFFAQVSPFAASEHETVILHDHARIDASLGDRLRGMAGDSGIVCTLKDSMKLVRVLGDSVPVWYLSENVVWDEPGPMPTAVRASLALLDPRTFDSGESPAT